MLHLPIPQLFRISQKALSNNLIFISLFYFYIVLKKKNNDKHSVARNTEIIHRALNLHAAICLPIVTNSSLGCPDFQN